MENLEKSRRSILSIDAGLGAAGRELATVQGFPPDSAFAGPLSSVYRQIGNAVPPPFAEAIARQFNNHREKSRTVAA